MIIKFISLILIMCTAELFALGTQSPSDPIFLFISNSQLVVILRIIITFAVAYIAFKGSFKYRSTKQIAEYVGLFLIAFGVIGITSMAVNDFLGAYIKGFDFLFAILAGNIFLISSLEYGTDRRRLSLRRAVMKKLPKSWAIKIGQWQT